jgi:hypothetical protein
MATQLHIEFEEAVGWIVTGAEAGPAGTVSLPLDGLRVTLDAVDVRRLVEVALFREDRSDAIASPVLDVCRRLLGPEVADTLARCPVRPQTLTVPEPSGPLWDQVARAARAWFLWTHSTSAPRLAALRLVAACRPLAALGAADRIPDRAWEALPAVIALGRSAARQPALVDRLPAADRAELLGALGTLVEELTADDWDGTGGDPVGDLRSLLTRVSDADLVALLADPEDEEETVVGSGSRIAAYESDPAPEARVEWRATSLDLRSRLGDFADEAFAGATARGRVPGSLNVEMTFRVGLTASDAPPLLARVYTWSGELLGQAPLRFSALPGELPRASNRVEVRPPERPDDLERMLADKQHGVHVDIAIAGLPPLDAAGLSREVRSRARQAAIGALLSRYQAGRSRLEAQTWDESARLYLLGGDPDRAAAAQDQAAAVTRRALLGQPAPWPDGADWASALLLSWRRAAREALEDTRPGNRATVLQPVVRDLAAGASGVAELAQACASLALTLLESAAPDSQEDRAEAADAAAALLREALRVRYLLGDQQGAQDLAARLAAVARDDVPGQGYASDD